ncbi:unnamed protein product, partial [Symbiodinium microadriaticum]
VALKLLACVKENPAKGEKAKAAALADRARELCILDMPLFETTVISDDEDSGKAAAREHAGTADPEPAVVPAEVVDLEGETAAAETAAPELAVPTEVVDLGDNGDKPAEIEASAADQPGLVEIEVSANQPDSLESFVEIAEMIEACTYADEPGRGHGSGPDGLYKYPEPLPVLSMDAILEKAAVADAPVYSDQGQDGGATKKRRKLPKNPVDAKHMGKVVKGDPKAADAAAVTVPGMAELPEDLSGITGNQLRAKARQSTGVCKQRRLCLPALVSSFRAKLPDSSKKQIFRLDKLKIAGALHAGHSKDRPALQWQDQGPFLEAETDDAFVQFMKETESPHDATSHKVVPTAFDSSDSEQLYNSSDSGEEKWIDHWCDEYNGFASDDELANLNSLDDLAKINGPQEIKVTPETNKAFQQDLFKKLVSADDLAGRRPYGFVTRMLRCFGWKRYESNQIRCSRRNPKPT